MKWSAREIARALHLHVFKARNVIVVPDCLWPGSECDLLVVRTDLRLIDVEIKISRQDLKADAHKDKWFDMPSHWTFGAARPKTPRAYPARIWKHYYAMPRAIWTDELLQFIQPASGILMISDRDTYPVMSMKRQARPNKEAKAISPEDVMDIARLSSNRMWAAYDEVDRHRRQQQKPEPLAQELVMHAGDLR
jgi:hypothetical protein